LLSLMAVVPDEAEEPQPLDNTRMAARLTRTKREI
jgi:hypothetical protein